MSLVVLRFQSAPEAFLLGVVPAHTRPAHVQPDLVLLGDVVELAGGVYTPCILRILAAKNRASFWGAVGLESQAFELCPGGPSRDSGGAVQEFVEFCVHVNVRANRRIHDPPDQGINPRVQLDSERTS